MTEDTENWPEDPKEMLKIALEARQRYEASDEYKNFLQAINNMKELLEEAMQEENVEAILELVQGIFDYFKKSSEREEEYEVYMLAVNKIWEIYLDSNKDDVDIVRKSHYLLEKIVFCCRKLKPLDESEGSSPFVALCLASVKALFDVNRAFQKKIGINLQENAKAYNFPVDPNLKEYTTEESDYFLHKWNEFDLLYGLDEEYLEEEGLLEEYQQTLHLLPLSPSEAEKRKQELGIEALIASGANLSEAVKEFGMEWLKE